MLSHSQSKTSNVYKLKLVKTTKLHSFSMEKCPKNMMYRIIELYCTVAIADKDNIDVNQL